MKRIIAVLVSVLIVCACVPSAFAGTGLSQTDSFKQAVKDYAKQYNEIYYTTTVLSENQDYVLFHLGGAVKAEKALVIGDYEFHSETWINNNGNIGYCYYDGTVVYGIKEAVENKLITAERLSELIPNTEKRDEDYCLRRLMSNGYYAEKASIMGYVGDDIICYAFDADSGYSGVFNIGDYEFTSMNDYEDTSINIFVIRKDYHGYFALPLKKAYDIMLIEDLEPYIEVLRKAQSEHNEGYYPFAFRKLPESVVTEIQFDKIASVSAELKQKNNPIEIKAVNKSLKAKKLKGKKRSFKALIIKNAKGKVSVKIVKKGTSAKLFGKASVKKNGKLTVKKGIYAKNTYKLRLKITVKGNSKYKPKTVYKTIKLKIK